MDNLKEKHQIIESWKGRDSNERVNILSNRATNEFYNQQLIRINLGFAPFTLKDFSEKKSLNWLTVISRNNIDEHPNHEIRETECLLDCHALRDAWNRPIIQDSEIDWKLRQKWQELKALDPHPKRKIHLDYGIRRHICKYYFPVDKDRSVNNQDIIDRINAMEYINKCIPKETVRFDEIELLYLAPETYPINKYEKEDTRNLTQKLYDDNYRWKIDIVKEFCWLKGHELSIPKRRKHKKSKKEILSRIYHIGKKEKTTLEKERYTTILKGEDQEKALHKQVIPSIDGFGRVRLSSIAKQRNRSIRKRFKPKTTTMQIHKHNKDFLQKYMHSALSPLLYYGTDIPIPERWDYFVFRVANLYSIYSDCVTPTCENESTMNDLTSIELHEGTKRLLKSLSLPNESLENTLLRAVKCLKGFELLKESEG